MSARRILLRLASFFAAFAAAVALVLLLAPAPPRYEACGLPPRAEVELITLDRVEGRVYTRLRFSPGTRRPTPERFRVRTYFFTAEGGARRVWTGGEIEVPGRSAALSFGPDSVLLSFEEECGWCADADAPPGGYFARVQIFHEGVETPLPSGESFFDISTAAPVVVRAGPPATR